MSFPDLAMAIEWAQARWLERPVPLRLHDHDTDGSLGGLRYSAAFLRDLRATCRDTMLVEVTENCYHPTLIRGQGPRECGDCWGVGVKNAWRERYRFPMWRAFSALLNASHDMPRHPHPAALIVALAQDWDTQAAARRIDRPYEVAEPLFLNALRKLHRRYEEGPVPRPSRPSWVDKSDSQRAAEEQAA